MSPSEKRDPFEMMGAAEACEVLGIPEKSRGNLYKVAGLPKPHQELRCGKIWKADDIRQLAHEREQRRLNRAGPLTDLREAREG